MKEISIVACACGCGGDVETPDARGRPRRFLPSHNTRMPRRPRTKSTNDTCVNGHQLTEDNTRWRGNDRICRACNRDWIRQYRARQRSTP